MLRISILLAGALILLPVDSQARTCLPDDPPARAMARADAVFEGRALPAPLPGFAVFQLVDVHKGELASPVTVRVPRGPLAPTFEPGTVHLVVAVDRGGWLRIDRCSGKDRPNTLGEPLIEAAG